jgi:hypothetical protein
MHQLFGCVAVSVAVNRPLALQTRARRIALARAITRHKAAKAAQHRADLATMQRLSFPQNLLPATPPTRIEEARP